MTASNWWLDESAHAGHEHLDPAYVAGYEAKAGYDPTDDIDVLRGHGMNSQSVVVDLGAGTGRFSVEIARECGRVIAVDVSPAMVVFERVTNPACAPRSQRNEAPMPSASVPPRARKAQTSASRSLSLDR